VNKYNEALEDAAFLYTRFQWQKDNNRKYPGECTQGDSEIWKIVDSASQDSERCHQLMENLIVFAQDHKNFSAELEAWCAEVLSRDPIHIRTRDDKWKKRNINNTQIWKLMMQYEEMVLLRLQDTNEKSNTFSQHFEYTEI
jgi:hypothetical protein